MEILTPTALAGLAISSLLFIIGFSLTLYSISTRKIKALESHLLTGYASLLSDEITKHQRFDNPIKRIKATLALMEFSTEPDIRRYVSDLKTDVMLIKDNAKNIKWTLDIRDGREDYGKYSFNINTTIADCLNEEKYGETVILRRSDNSGSNNIVGTKMEIKTAIKIVVDNALTYGKHPVDIYVTKSKSRYIRISIEDQGESIFPEETRNIIDEIDKTYNDVGLWSGGVQKLISESYKSSSGNGMGLIVAHLIAKSYNGGIYLVDRGELFEGVECKSTTVIIELSRS